MSGTDDEDDGALCDLCGAATGEAWIAVEVSRPVPPPHVVGGHEVSDTDCVWASFCSQEHAARWLARPLPPLAPWRMEDSTRRSRACEALVLTVVFVVLLAVLAFAAVGAATLVDAV